MGTFLKYLFYIALVVVIYLVGKGVYEGQIDEKTTVGQVVSDIGTGTKEMVKAASMLPRTRLTIIKRRQKKILIWQSSEKPRNPRGFFRPFWLR